MLTVDSISKSYGDTKVLENISFELKRGDIVGLLGANGAGKTTLLKILAAYHQPDCGSVFLDDVSILEESSKAKSSIGYLSENTPLYDYMTVSEYIDFMLLSMGIFKESIDRERMKLLEQLSLSNHQHKSISQLSSGFRQRCAIAGALAGNLSMLVLDEPAKGLDPQQIAEFRSIIRSFDQDIIIIISSHILSEIELLCDRVLILNNGKLHYDSFINRANKMPAAEYRVEISGSEDQLTKLKSINGIRVMQSQELHRGYWIIHIRISKEEFVKSKALIITDSLYKLGFKLHCLEQISDSLEKIYISVMESSDE